MAGLFPPLGKGILTCACRFAKDNNIAAALALPNTKTMVLGEAAKKGLPFEVDVEFIADCAVHHWIKGCGRRGA